MSDRGFDNDWDSPPRRRDRRGGLAARAAGAVALVLLAALAVGTVWVLLQNSRQEIQVALPSVTIPLPPPLPESPSPATPSPEAQPPAPPSTSPQSTPAPAPQTQPTPPATQQSPQPPEATAIPPVPPPPGPPAPTKPSPTPPPTTPPAERVPVPAPDGLAPSPDPGLVEESPDGPLPNVGQDGRKPWQVYSRPFDTNDRRPRIALIISGLGQSSAATEAAIQRLPGTITLAFAPYARKLDEWSRLARAAGHEVLLTVPMEPVGYPSNDPGPHTLLTTLGPDQNRERLSWLLSRFTGYTGVVNLMGSRFTTDSQALRPVLSEINRRGLLFVDSRSSLNSVAGKLAQDIGLPNATNNRFIDVKAARDDIDARLAELEEIAKADGVAVGIGSPYPVTIERVALWVQDLESKGIVLAPVSAAIDKQGK